MKNINWDYSELATSYKYRPEYSENIIEKIIETSLLLKKSKICDIGAGIAHLTIPLAKLGYKVVAIEPNVEMTKYGKERTKKFVNVIWYQATGEYTKKKDNEFDLVTFGSSFNVMDRNKALKEVHRILKKKCWFAALWNHRDLKNPIQMEIEKIIKSNIPDYDYGSRREDQTKIIKSSNLFTNIRFFEDKIYHSQEVKSVISAWKSHATLHRQAGLKFTKIIDEITFFLNSMKVKKITIPYYTRLWMAQKK